MAFSRRRLLGSAAFAAQPALPQTPVAAGDWPNRPLRLILPVAPAGFADITARLVQPFLTRSLGQPVIIENWPGGAGIPATEATMRARPDGLTFGLIFTAHAANPAMFQTRVARILRG